MLWGMPLTNSTEWWHGWDRRTTLPQTPLPLRFDTGSLALLCTLSRFQASIFLTHGEFVPACFFFANAFRPAWPGRCIWGLVCVPRPTRALDQGGVEPRLAVSLRPEGHRQYHYTTTPLRTCPSLQPGPLMGAQLPSVIPALGHRLAQASHMRSAYAHIVHGISRSFTMKGTNLIMDHLIRRCRGNLIPYMTDGQLLLDPSVNIVHELGLTMLAEMQVVED